MGIAVVVNVECSCGWSCTSGCGCIQYLSIYNSSGGVWGIVRCHDFPHIYFITTRNIFHPKSCKKYLNILIPIS